MDAAPIHDAARVGGVAVVQKELGKGVDVNIKYCGVSTPLMVAARYGQDEIVQQLLEAGADVRALGSIAFDIEKVCKYPKTAQIIENFVPRSRVAKSARK